MGTQTDWQHLITLSAGLPWAVALTTWPPIGPPPSWWVALVLLGVALTLAAAASACSSPRRTRRFSARALAGAPPAAPAAPETRMADGGRAADAIRTPMTAAPQARPTGPGDGEVVQTGARSVRAFVIHPRTGLEAQLAYARAVRTFYDQRDEQSTTAVRQASHALEEVYGVRGAPGVHWPIPMGASLEFLAQVEAQCLEALGKAEASTSSLPVSVGSIPPGGSIWHDRPYAPDHASAGVYGTQRVPVTVPAVFEAAFATSVVSGPGSATESQPGAPDERALAQEAAPAPPAPFSPNARMRFLRWLVESRRITR
jgi:hypothetical protein